MYKTWMKDKVIRLRWRKHYSEAHSHVAIGKVLQENSSYVALECKTFHFQRILSGSKKGILEGEVCVRMIPWNVIEVMHELEADTDYTAPITMDSKGNIVLDNKHNTMIARTQDFGE
jgi:hypothetical protein